MLHLLITIRASLAGCDERRKKRLRADDMAPGRVAQTTV
jgi:hypothetical protein